MALGDTLRRIVASDNFILNAAGALVGIKNPNANGLDLRVDQPPAYLPSILAQSGVPTILPSSGSSNASGQITLTTALPYQPAGTVLLYLPAGVVVGDATGGLKPVVFSSTTVCQITGNPVTANASYTQTTNANLTMASITVPGGSMGANGKLRVSQQWSVINNANQKPLINTFGGQLFMQDNAATSLSAIGASSIRNRGSALRQVSLPIANLTSGLADMGGQNAASPFGYFTVDTTVDQPLLLTAQLNGAATDYVILEGYTVELLPAA